PGAGNPPLYRFDAPGGGYGVCYLGVDEEAAFVEGVLHRAIPRRIISARTLAARAISVIHILEDIRAVRLYGQYLVGNGATAAVVHGDDYRGLSQPWSKAIHDHAVRADGILYTARHDDSVMALALFDRAAHKIAAGARHPLSDRDVRTLRLLDRYGIGLEP
ncbi:MAG TPA: RES family NAD+ phosphorylase, partial [Longimicrobium sp.]|nr:RES family NAD+ phosphorylase [Longimicrobium sp.]